MTPKNDNELLKAAAAFVKGIDPIEDDMLIDYLLGKLPADEAEALTDLREQDQELNERVARMREIIAPVLDPEYMAQAKARLFRKLALQDRTKSLERIRATIIERAGEAVAQARETIAGFVLDLATLCQAPVPAPSAIRRSDLQRTHDTPTDWAGHLGKHLSQRHPDWISFPLPEGGEYIISKADRHEERWIIRARPGGANDPTAFQFELLDENGDNVLKQQSEPDSKPPNSIEVTREIADAVLKHGTTTVRVTFG